MALRLENERLFDYPSHSDATLVRQELAGVLHQLNAFLVEPGGVVAAIKGDWGTGKTSLLKAIGSYYQDLHEFPVVFFEAWKYQDEESPLVPLLQHIMGPLEEAARASTAGRAKQALMKARGALGKAAKASLVLAAGHLLLPSGISLGDVKETLKQFDDLEEGLLKRRCEYDKRMKAMSKAVAGLADVWKPPADEDRRNLWETYLADLEPAEIREELKNPLVARDAFEGKRRLVLIVDDLDRCLPEKAFALLEAVRFYLTVNGVLVVMGIDDRLMARFVERRYGMEGVGSGQRAASGAGEQQATPGVGTGFSGREFLDKLFHWSHELRFVGFGAVREVYFNDVPLDRAATELLEGLDLPYRAWIRIRNRIAALPLDDGKPRLSEVWLAVVVQVVPEADYLLRRQPGLWKELEAGSAEKDDRTGTPLLDVVLEGATDKEMGRTLAEAYKRIAEARAR